MVFTDPVKEVFEKPEPLKGIRVLDVTRIIYGPWAATILASLGAEVIHVEIPGSGDQLVRAVTPRGIFPRNLSPGMACANLNKYFVAIDLHKPEGRDLLKKLAARSDVIMENFKAETFDRWGIGYRQLTQINPRLIYVSMQGFGNWGPMMDRPSYDAYAQGITGLAEITGFREGMALKTQAWIGDFLSGTIAAYLTLVAIHHRDRTGKGQFIDLAQSEVLMRAMDWTWIYIGITGKNRERYGNRDVAIVPACLVRCRDGFVAIAAFSEEEFEGLCRAMNRADLLAYRDIAKRLENQDEVYDAIEEWSSKLSVREILSLAENFGFAVAELNDPEKIHKSRHFSERGAVWKYEDPIYGDMCHPFALAGFEKSPGRIKWTMRPVGFDNDYVFRQILGISEEELEKLYQEGVVGKWDERFPATAPPPDWDGKRGLLY